MEQPDPDVVDAVLSLTLAVAAGDDDAVEFLLRSHDAADLAIAGGGVAQADTGGDFAMFPASG